MFEKFDIDDDDDVECHEVMPVSNLKVRIISVSYKMLSLSSMDIID